MSAELAIRDEAGYFVAVSEIRALVERIEKPTDAKSLADRARAAQVWAERQRLGQEKVNLAIAARFWAARREGELLTEMRVSGELARGGSKLRDGTLEPLGITKAESKRTQDLAAIPADRYAALIDDCIEAGRLNLTELHRRADRNERVGEIAEERARHEAEARAELERLEAEGARAFQVDVGDVRTWRPRRKVQAVIADPPYVTADAVELYAELARFACEVLEPYGALAAMVPSWLLERVVLAIHETVMRSLVYRWAIVWHFADNANSLNWNGRVYDQTKLVLVYHRLEIPGDAPVFNDFIGGQTRDKGKHEWQQSPEGFERLVEALTRPGDTVCDPFAGAGTTAVAALRQLRLFVGCDIDEQAVATTLERLRGAAA